MIKNKYSDTNSYSRRGFLRRAGAGTGLLVLGGKAAALGFPANEALNVALVGVAGRGGWFVDAIPGLGQNVVAMCDVNERKASGSFAALPKARKFFDFRRMFDAMEREIDAVVVATPDHTHAVITSAAIRHGKGVYCEKPLTHHVFEARRLRQMARERGVATQMGNQGTASLAFRKAAAILQAQALGEIREVHVWNTNGGPGDVPLPEGEHPIPDYLHWDLWLGPAADRPYHSRWLNWHGWRDFGTGQLGNWACHTMNVVFMGLRIDVLWDPRDAAPSPTPCVTVSAEVPGHYPHSFPRWEKVDFQIPARRNFSAVTVHWYNGSGRAPAPREHIEEILGRRLDWGDAGERRWADHAGCLVVGDRGSLHSTGHNTSFSIHPESLGEELNQTVPSLPSSPGHEAEWLRACRGGEPAMSRFEYSADLTEMVLLGNLATQLPGEIRYDPVAMKITNDARADSLLYRDYRHGWEL